jgi:hypothetical protein
MVLAGPVDRADRAAPTEATAQVGQAEEARGPLSSKGALAALEVRAAQGALEVPQAPGVREALAVQDRAAEARDAEFSVHRAARVDQVVLADQAVRSPAMVHLVRAMLFTQLP